MCFPCLGYSMVAILPISYSGLAQTFNPSKICSDLPEVEK